MEGETVFAIVVGVALVAFSLFVVGHSFLRGISLRENPEVAPSTTVGGSDEVGLDSIYDAIETLELDFQLGNVPEEPYRAQLQAYRVQAAVAVRQLIEAGEAGPELLLEHEVLAARSALRNGLPTTCPECGSRVASDAARCPNCGAETPASPRAANDS